MFYTYPLSQKWNLVNLTFRVPESHYNGSGKKFSVFFDLQYNFSIVLRQNCTKILVENNTNQLIVIDNKNCKEIISKILNAQ